MAILQSKFGTASWNTVWIHAVNWHRITESVNVDHRHRSREKRSQLVCSGQLPALSMQGFCAKFLYKCGYGCSFVGFCGCTVLNLTWKTVLPNTGCLCRGGKALVCSGRLAGYRGYSVASVWLAVLSMLVCQVTLPMTRQSAVSCTENSYHRAFSCVILSAYNISWLIILFSLLLFQLFYAVYVADFVSYSVASLLRCSFSYVTLSVELLLKCFLLYV